MAPPVGGVACPHEATGDLEGLSADLDSKGTAGPCLVNLMHIAASVFINDDESGLHHDYDAWLDGARAGSRRTRG